MQLASQPASPVTPTPVVPPTPVAATPVLPEAPAATKAAPTKQPVWKKQIPTLAGIAVLVVALVVGVLALGGGTGVFAPRATPQTTPKQVKITNVSDKAFSVSFYTDEATSGFVKYGLADNDLKLQASDDRDQLAGSVGKFTLHHITVKGLKPNTQYFFTLGTGSGSTFDNNGAAFKLKTAVDPGTPPPAAKTVYGSVMSAGGTPADGSIVYLAAEGGGELSTLVKSSGSWAISLANARLTDGSNYLEIADETPLTIFAQGTALAQTAKTTAMVSEAQPLPDISLAVGGGTVAKVETPVGSDSADLAAPSASDSAEVASDSAETALSAETNASNSAQTTSTGGTSLLGGTSSTASAVTSSPSAVLDLETLATAKPGAVTVVEAPVVMGVAAPKAKVKIEIHSETEITQTVTADANGNFELDVSQFQDLEPGEHTVTYSYIDPETNQEVTKTHTFTVAGKSGSEQLAMANPSPTATSFGSGNPYPITSPTKASSTMSAGTSTRSAVVSTTSGTYTSGSVGATFALLAGGFFLMAIGWWSWWLAGQVREETA